MHGVEAVRLAEEVVRGLAAAADARQLGDAVRLDVQLPAGLDDRRRDRVVPATRAQRADLALVVAPGEADGVAAERGVVEFWFGEVGHATRSEEHTSELQSLMRISYAVLCLKKTKTR